MPESYVDTMSVYHPTRKVHALGDGYDYEQLRAEDGLPLPTFAELEPLSRELCMERKWREIQTERDRRKFNGVRIGTNWFHTDDSSRIQQIGLVMMGASLPAIQWKTLNGGFVTMTPTLAMQIFQSVAGQDIAIFAAAEQHKVAMRASSNPKAYDFSAGWPPTFGG